MKDEIRERGMADDDVISYVVVRMGAGAVAAWLPSTFPEPWNWVLYGWELMLALVGTAYLYQSNRGRMGQLFLQRYFSVGWVVGIRWLVATGLGWAFLAAGLRAMTPLTEVQRTGVWVGYLAGAELVFYARVARHLRDLSRDD